MPEVTGEDEAARVSGVDVGTGGKGAGGEVGGAALEEEAAALEATSGGDLCFEEAVLGGLDLLLGLRDKGRRRGGAMARGCGVRVWGLGEERGRGGGETCRRERRWLRASSICRTRSSKAADSSITQPAVAAAAVGEGLR